MVVATGPRAHVTAPAAHTSPVQTSFLSRLQPVWQHWPSSSCRRVQTPRPRDAHSAAACVQLATWPSRPMRHACCLGVHGEDTPSACALPHTEIQCGLPGSALTRPQQRTAAISNEEDAQGPPREKRGHPHSNHCAIASVLSTTSLLRALAARGVCKQRTERDSPLATTRTVHAHHCTHESGAQTRRTTASAPPNCAHPMSHPWPAHTMPRDPLGMPRHLLHCP